MAPRKSATASKKRAVTHESDEDESGGDGTDYENEEAPAKGKKKAAAKGKGKGKKRAAAAGTDDDEEDDNAPVATGKKKGGKAAAMNDDLRQKLVMEMTRHAIFCEQTRKPFRADDVRKTILANGYTRHYNDLFPRVQKTLRSQLGMELVPMRHKEGAAGKAPLKSYTLRSTLPLDILRALAEPDEKLLPEQAELPDDEPEAADALAMYEFRADEGYARDVKREEGGAYGVLGVILGLILVSGKVLGEDQLVVYLRKLGLELDDPIPASLAARPIPKEAGLSLQKYLALLASQGYLEKGKSGTGQAAATQGKSQRNGTQSGDASVEWRWGARAESELGEAGVARFVKAVYESKHGELGGGDDDEPGDRARGQTGEKIMKEIGRASGNVNLAEATAVKGYEAA